MSYTLRDLTDAYLAKEEAASALSAAVNRLRDIERSSWQFHLGLGDVMSDVRDDKVITVRGPDDRVGGTFEYIVSTRPVDDV